jgi:hypothetical protein
MIAAPRQDVQAAFCHAKFSLDYQPPDMLTGASFIGATADVGHPTPFMHQPGSNVLETSLFEGRRRDGDVTDERATWC